MTISQDLDLVRADLVSSNASVAVNMSLAGMVVKAASTRGLTELSPRHNKALRAILDQIDVIRKMLDENRLWDLVDDDPRDGSTSAQVIAAAARQDVPNASSATRESLNLLISQRDSIVLEGNRVTVTRKDDAKKFADWLEAMARSLVHDATKMDLSRTSEYAIA